MTVQVADGPLSQKRGSNYQVTAVLAAILIHSQDMKKGQRPALAVSNRVFNKLTNLTLVCPITENEKRFSFTFSPLH